ncbi:MAG: hypothetical protein FJX72_05035 [Armatimonadetes bacterium]|nr:hypothetical protein [Armatimonadota bacterium]
MDYHVFRLRQNRQDDWSMGLLAEAIGGLVHARPASFSDAYSWAETPVDWVGRALDAFGEFFSMDSAVHSREPSGTWKPTQAFKGPSRVWLQRHALAESWDTLSPNEKLLAVFLHLSAPDRYPLQVDSHLEQHPMVRSVLLLRHGASDDSRGATALQAHELIADAVLVRVPKPKSRVAIHPDELEIDFERALPLCRVLGSGVKYCEGRHMSKPPFDAWKRWKDDPHGNVRPISVAIFRDTEDPIDCQCPRLERARGYRDSGCQVLTDGAEGHAHLFARRKLPWSRWTLLEALEACGYPPNLIEIFQRRGDKPRIEPPVAVENEYVNKIAGTLNRINELRDRLRCGWRDGEIDPAKGCGQPLAPQFEYSKFPAAYGITVWGSCSASNEGGPHDAGCYFSHCFRCMGTIDNRESPIRDGTSNRLYVCAHCGGWSRQQGTESNALYPGEFRRCGKCGSDDSILDRECKLVICGNAACAHTWRPFDKIWSQL